MEKIETSSIKDLRETNKLLEDEKTALAQEISRLRTVIQHQQNEIERLSSVVHTEKHTNTLQQLIDANLDCLVLKKEKESLSDTVEKLNTQVSALSVEVETKDKQLRAKKSELEKNNTQWINTVKTLKQKVVENEDQTRAIQDQYTKLLQDLLIPHMVCIVYLF